MFLKILIKKEQRKTAKYTSFLIYHFLLLTDVSHLPLLSSQIYFLSLWLCNRLLLFLSSSMLMIISANDIGINTFKHKEGLTPYFCLLIDLVLLKVNKQNNFFQNSCQGSSLISLCKAFLAYIINPSAGVTSTKLTNFPSYHVREFYTSSCSGPKLGNIHDTVPLIFKYYLLVLNVRIRNSVLYNEFIYTLCNWRYQIFTEKG